MRVLTLPKRARGLKVGLLGGSFDPPHAGHLHISEVALRRFALDEVWWLFSPGNPLKRRGPAALPRRMAAAQRMFWHPRIRFSNIEEEIGTRYTSQTIAALKDAAPEIRFVWLMGADNLVQFHHWQHWRQIVDQVPMGIMARPGDRLKARLSRTSRIFRHARLPAAASPLLADCAPPAWCFINLPMSKLASSAIRADGGWTVPDPAPMPKR